MGAQLRVILDQAGTVVEPDEAEAARELTAALVRTAPLGCSVMAIVPAGSDPGIRGLLDVQVLTRSRAELAAAWARGAVRGVGGGLIHAPSLMAPLVRHDREHSSDQTVVTLWDLRPWTEPHTVAKAVVSAQKAMLRRAVKHADAVVVPTHAMAERLAQIAPLEGRIRVIAGAAPAGFDVLSSPEARRAALRAPADYLAVTGPADRLVPAFRAAATAGIGAVVLDVAEGSEGVIREAAEIGRLSTERLTLLRRPNAPERAAVLQGARAFYAGATAWAWPWRVVEATTVGVPVVAAASEVHSDVIADGGVIAVESDAGDALLAAMEADAARLRVLAHDRSRAFSWLSAAERVWVLHADL